MVYEETLRKLNVPNNELFYDIDKPYEHFIQKATVVIDNITPSKDKRI